MPCLLDSLVRLPSFLPPSQPSSISHNSWTASSQPLTVPSRLTADLFNNGLMKLPNDQQPGASWLPTLCLDIDFKVKFPLAIPSSSTSSPYAARTVGTYNRTDFIGAGRYQAITEVWTAPGELGEPRPVGETGDAWRKQMQILAVATQVRSASPLPSGRCRP